MSKGKAEDGEASIDINFADDGTPLHDCNLIVLGLVQTG